jgi:hypothetical protein
MSIRYLVSITQDLKILNLGLIIGVRIEIYLLIIYLSRLLVILASKDLRCLCYHFGDKA